MTIPVLRINKYGYGARRGQIPVIRFKLNGGVEPFRRDIDNKDTTQTMFEFPITMTQMQLDMTDMHNLRNILQGSTIAQKIDIDLLKLYEQTDYVDFSAALLAYAAQDTNNFNYNGADFNYHGFKYKFDDNGDALEFSEASPAHVTLAKHYLRKYFAPLAIENGQDPHTLTWYQIQYAIISKGTTYLSPEDAETYCKTNYDWCRETEETT